MALPREIESKAMGKSTAPDRPSKLNPVDLGLRRFAQVQRGSMPRAEALFWQQVRAGRFQGLKFKRQVPIAPYIVDFLCIWARVVVELDGAPHEDDTRRKRDTERDAWLIKQGFQVLRFPNDLVLSNLGAVLDMVGLAVDQRRAGNPPPSAGEGGPRVSEGRVGTKSRKRGAQVSPERSRSPLPPGIRPAPSPAEGGGF